jgi:hypothetical protein
VGGGPPEAGPIWAEDHLSGAKQNNRVQTIQTLQQIFANGDAPNTDQSAMVGALLDHYAQAAADFATAGQQRSYSGQLADQKTIKDQWVAYVNNLEVQVPALAPIINSVFKEALVVRTT